MSRDEHLAHPAGVVGHLAAEDGAGGPDLLVARLHALRALEADRRRDHAVRADPPLAPDAPDVGLAVRVAVAGRGLGRRRVGRRALRGLRGHRVRRRAARPRWCRSRRPRPGGPSPPVVVPAIASTTCAAAAVGDLAEDRVPPVEVRGGADRDEELRAVGARAGVGHRQQVRPVELQLRVELVGEAVARAAGARCPAGRRPGS